MMIVSETSTQVLVRYGWQATVAKFDVDSMKAMQDLDGERSAELSQPVWAGWICGLRVVVETPRGIELGTVLRDCQPDSKPMGRVLRPMRSEDELLHRHLQEFGQTAFQRCIEWLEASGHDAVLLEVEPLLDCKTLLFHFLSGIDPLLQQHVDHLASLYESEVASSDFVRRVINGCGPGCGTESASGSGCGTNGGCSQCALACNQTLATRLKTRN